MRVIPETDLEKGRFSVWIDGEPLAVNKKFVNTFQHQKVTRIVYASRQHYGSVYLDNILVKNGKASGVKRSGTLSEEDILFAGTYYDARTGIILIMRQDGVLTEEAIPNVLSEAERLYGEELLREAELYVSPNAAEGGDGSKAKPFVAIDAAQKRVRALLTI